MKKENNTAVFHYEGAAFRGATTRWGLWWVPGNHVGNARYRLDGETLEIERLDKKGQAIVSNHAYALKDIRQVVLHDTQDTWCLRMQKADGRWIEICSLIRLDNAWEDAYPAFKEFVLALHKALRRCGHDIVYRRGNRSMRLSGVMILAVACLGGGRLAWYRLGTDILTVPSRVTEGAGWAAVALGMAIGFRLARVGGLAQPSLGRYDPKTPPLK